MANITLKEKIEDISFWIIVFLIIYLIVAYLIQSEWLSKILEFSEIYEILQDGLTITAAFLAPLAAFVLFSDWREQHKLVKTEKDTEQIIQNIYDVNKILLDLFSTICEGEKNNHNTYKTIIQRRNIIQLESNSISNDINRLHVPQEGETDFIKHARHIVQTIKDTADLMYNLQLEYDKSDDEYSPDISEISNNLSYLDTLQEELNACAINLKV